MKKVLKYFVAILSLFLVFGMNVNAATIKETTENDNYDTIEYGSMIIGVTKFSEDVVMTASRVAKAGANDAKLYALKNATIEGYESPTIYVYYGIGGWYEFDDDNMPNMVTDENVLNELNNKEIYYVNNAEKVIDIDTNGIDVDEERLPKGVTLDNGKLLVKATSGDFKIYTTDNKEVNYVVDNGEFVINFGICFTVQDGYITDYDSNCLSDVVIPEKINDETIIGIKENAFNNKGIKTVDINKNIIHLENNAFANNELTKVIIREKYDRSDFETYGNNIFGEFGDYKVTYDNELVRFMNLFDSNVKVKVKEGLEYYAEPWIAFKSEIKRLGLEEKELDYFNNNSRDGGFDLVYVYNSRDYSIELCFTPFCNSTGEDVNFNNEYLMIFEDVELGKLDYKKVSYELEYITVDEETENKIEEAIKESKELIESNKEKFIKGEYSTKLFDEEKINKIFSEKGFDISFEAGDHGDGYDNLNIIEINDKLYLNCYSNVFTKGIKTSEGFVGEVSFDNAIGFYDVNKLEGDFDSIDEKMEAALEDFLEITEIKNYEKWPENTLYSTSLRYDNKGYAHSISIEDNDSGNSWIIEMEVLEEDPITKSSSIDMDGNEVINYFYYPNISFDDYSSTNEWKEAAIDKLETKLGVDLSGYYSSLNIQTGTYCHPTEENSGEYICEYVPNEEGIYEYRFVLYLDNPDNRKVSYYIYLTRYSTEKLTPNAKEDYEVSFDVNEYKNEFGYIDLERYDDYHKNAVDTFINEKGLTDYEVQNWGSSIKDTETNTFITYSGSSNGTVYSHKVIIDYSTLKTWNVYYPEPYNN